MSTTDKQHDPPRAPRSMMQQPPQQRSSTSRQRGESAERSTSSTRGPQVTSEKGKNSLAKVPCKFFRAGACSNDACPFLHQEQGQPKQICPWYQTQSCKFGAKCALAHVLPGQPMSMDRKNKRAQQLAQREAEAAGNGALATSPPSSSGLPKPPSPAKAPSTQTNNVSLTKRQSGFMPTPSQPAATVQSQPILAGSASSPGTSASSANGSKSVWGPNLNPAIKAPPTSASGLTNGPSRQVGFAPPPDAAQPSLSSTPPTTTLSDGPLSPSSSQQARASNIAASVLSPALSQTKQEPQQTFGQSPRGIILDFLNSGHGAAASIHPELHGDAIEYLPQSPPSRAAAQTSSGGWPTGSMASAHHHNLTSPQLRGLDMPQSLPANGTHAFGTSPFSNPGSRSIFLQPSSFGSDDNHLDGVFEAKLQGQQLKRPEAWNWSGHQVKPASFAGFNAALASRPETEIDEEEEDRAEEDFLPSSLHDLLTPDELQRAHRAQQKLTQQHLFELDGASKSFPDHQALLQQPATQQKWASSTAQSQAFMKDDPLQQPNGASPARRMTLLSHAPGSSLPPAITSGMSRMQLHPAPSPPMPAENNFSTSPWAAAPMARESPPRPTAHRQRRTSHGSTANNPGLFVGSPLAQAWTHPNEDDELTPASLLRKSAGERLAPGPQPAPHSNTPGLADDDEGLPFSMD